MSELDLLARTFADMPPWRGDVPEGFFPNFLGTLTDREFVEIHPPSNHLLTSGDNGAETPAPGIDDGEIFFEQAAILKAVRAAEGQFTMIELGGGFAARTVDAHAAVQRLNPLPCQFVVVEAEPTHFEWAQRHLRTNGIDPNDHWLINAAVGIDSRPCLFMFGAGLYCNAVVSPKDAASLVEDVRRFEMADHVMHELMMRGQCNVAVPYNTRAGQHIFNFAFVNTLPLRDILQPLRTVDLMDIDIQGAEAWCLPPAMEMLDRKVKRIHLATHAAEIHSALWDRFFEHEWLCEFDFAPSSHHQTPTGAFDTEDGILQLVNPRLVDP